MLLIFNQCDVSPWPPFHIQIQWTHKYCYKLPPSSQYSYKISFYSSEAKRGIQYVRSEFYRPIRLHHYEFRYKTRSASFFLAKIVVKLATKFDVHNTPTGLVFPVENAYLDWMDKLVERGHSDGILLFITWTVFFFNLS